MFRKLAIFSFILFCNVSFANDSIEANKAIAVKALTQMFDQLNVDLIDEYYSEDYIQHSPSIKDGISGLKEAVLGMKEGNFSIKREIFRTLSEGDFVFVQSRVSFNGSLNSVVVDIFRFEEGKIIEHWDTTQVEIDAAKTANGNGMLDGGGDADKVMSTSSLTKNTQTVRDLIGKGFVSGDVVFLESLFGNEYIQHNPQVPNGKEAVLGFFENGGFPAKVHLTIAQGDLVGILAEYGSAESGHHNACADLFRLDDNSKVVEHWDTCMAVPNNTDFLHDDGMF